MAANDADDAYVMDLSERHLSSRGLHDALARLQRVLHDEDERDGVSVARPLELLCAGNDVAKFALPASEKPPRPETLVGNSASHKDIGTSRTAKDLRRETRPAQTC